MDQINETKASDKNNSFLEKKRGMREINVTKEIHKQNAFMEKLRESSGQNPDLCVQCMKCTGGCPFQFTMDYPPSQIMRMLQNGLVDEVLDSFAIWTCAACATCSARCQRGIDIAKVMDTLRVIAYQKGITGKGKNMHVFHTAFMNSVSSHGRLYEIGLALGINIGTLNLTQDTDLGLPMVMKGKLSLLPHRIKGRGEIKKLYDYAKKIGE
ncbi:MAG TPA: 4Fe-4S dicluster domain-containing protein [Desulfobacteria bacterium]|nr:4Fe-4S dicluster domain-containing protein [Desulfobacteria bacterium]